MKQCPKCQASISDTAKFCIKCGCNIKKFEEEQTQQTYFCPECGTKFSGGDFCPECGYNIGKDLGSKNISASPDAFSDDWLSDVESTTNADVKNMKVQESKAQTEKAFAIFEYKEHADGTYTITRLKDIFALKVFVPKGVVNIADHAFEGCAFLQIDLPDGLLKIGKRAFARCKHIREIRLPSSLQIIDDEAFADCSSLDIDISYVSDVGKDVIKNTLTHKKLLAEEIRKAEAEKRAAEARRAEETRKIQEARKAEEARKVAEARRVEEARKAELAKWNVGKTVTLGSYPYDKTGNCRPIEWIVLERKEGNALLISKQIIDTRRYHYADENDLCKTVTWDKCSLRQWLNGDFYRTAFDSLTKSNIMSTRIYVPRIEETEYGVGFFKTEEKKIVFGSVWVNDNIFLLSKDEAEKYFPSCELRKCSPTEYAQSKKVNASDFLGERDWWLRTTNEEYHWDVYSVDYDGRIYGNMSNTYYIGVRPAMWVKIDI